MIALLTKFLFLQSLCARLITSAKARAKTVFGHLKGWVMSKLTGCEYNLKIYSVKIYRKVFLKKNVLFKMFYLPVKTSCPPVGNIT